VLKVLMPRLGKLDALLEYGEERMRVVAAQRGLDWDALGEEARERLVDTLLHEA
jgi:hypothetical protein